MISEMLSAPVRQIALARADMRKVSNWKSESQTSAAVQRGALWSYRKCGKCGHHDIFTGGCSFNGPTENGASCDFWSEGAL